jgi:hypothetical protein
VRSSTDPAAILWGVGLSERIFRRGSLVDRRWLWKAYAVLAVVQTALGVYELLTDDASGFFHVVVGGLWGAFGWSAFLASRPLVEPPPAGSRDGRPS